MIMAKLNIYKDLLRVRYSMYPVAAALTGSLIGMHFTEHYDYMRVFLSAFVILLLWWGGMISNQIIDAEIDRKAFILAQDGEDDISATRECFPIATGAISVKNAVVFASLIYFLAFLSAYRLGIPCLLTATTIFSLTQLYNKYFKLKALLGSLFFALLISSSFLMGGLGANHVTKLHLVIILSTLFYHTGVHIFGCIKDYNSDKQVHVNTFAVRVGIKKAAIVGVLFLSTGYIISMIPAYLNWLSPYYLIPVFASFIIGMPKAIKTVMFPFAFMGWRTLSAHITAATILYLSYSFGLIKGP